MKNDSKNIKYIIPNFLSFNRNEILLNIYDKHKEITRENTSIYSFYGTFPNAIWNGGRLCNDFSNSPTSFMKKVRDFYNKRGIVITFTFTNPHIDETHLKDPYCNEIMEVFNNGKNEVLVSSPILEKYIRENYPEYKINKSITIAKGKISIEDFGKYNLIVLDKHLNKNFEYLKSINEKEKIEILCDECCPNYCAKSKEHYSEIGQIQLGNKRLDNSYGLCKYNNKVEYWKYVAERNKNSLFYIKPEEIYEYSKMGFKYFKLSAMSRSEYDFLGIENIINYCIKPEYQLDLRVYMMEDLKESFRNHVNEYLSKYENYRCDLENKYNPS